MLTNGVTKYNNYPIFFFTPPLHTDNVSKH